jgi:hypothetical protein
MIRKKRTIYSQSKKKLKKNTQAPKRKYRKNVYWKLLFFQQFKKIVVKKFRLFIAGTAITVLFLFFFFTGSLYVFIQTHEEVAANFAYDVLRPVLGDTVVISIESFYFTILDKQNQIIYSFNKKPTQAVTKNVPTPSISPEDTTFTLRPIKPIISNAPLTGEGIWTPIPEATKEAALAQTIFRPDKERPYAVVTIVKMDMNSLIISASAGLKDPGGVEKPGAGIVPKYIQNTNRLLVGFNGGFQGKDGNYGMIVDKTEYLPLLKNLGTIITYKNTKPQIIKYTGKKLDKTVSAARQNGPLLIENAAIVASSSAWNMQTWGLTTTNSMYTWRSGIGVTKDGHLLYACGPSLVPETLATALKAAGAINAMQLDINPVWVRFVLFHPLGKGEYAYTPLLTSMVNGGEQYLHGYQRDFFYVFKKLKEDYK